MELLEHLSLLVLDQAPDEALTDDLVQRADAMAGAVREQWLEVALAGPPSAARAARSVRDAGNDFVLYLHIHISGRRLYSIRSPYSSARKSHHRLSRALDAFVIAAETALDDDGSKK
ncbi:hypothetical protein [Streptomyces mirabilis]